MSQKSVRGAGLDFIDHPLNNRWWLEDEFAAPAKLPDEAHLNWQQQSCVSEVWLLKE